MDLNKENCTVVAKHLTKRMENLLSANSEDELIGRKPEDVVLLGNIKAGQTIESIVDKDDFEVDNDYKSVPSIGMNFHTNIETSKITLKLYGKLYYRISPTFDDNLKYLLKKYGRKERKKFSTPNELMDYFDNIRKKDPNFTYPIERIMYLYKSISLEDFIPSIELDISNDTNFKYTLEVSNKVIEEKLREKCCLLFNESINVKNSNKSLRDFLDKREYELLISRKVERERPD